jgi:3-deoxy-manno-octulosonate cytidylyltransferase (CMP-KDO synthetase)
MPQHDNDKLRRPDDCLLVIPARMASTRLPNKPLAEIGGLPMIVHVLRRANEAAIGRVVVATDNQAIVDAVEAHGGEAVMTDTGHQSGSDRVWEAVGRVDPTGAVRYVVNLQGDLPMISPFDVAGSLRPLLDGQAEIATLASPIHGADERANPNIVKLVGTQIGASRFRALYFTRATAPWGEGLLYHHIGIYAYRREALQKFVALKPSALEKRERLEQLRAVEAGMRIDVEIVDKAPVGVDTQADLDAARALLGARRNASIT